MKITNINWKKIKNISKTKLFAIGLVGLVFLSGCSLKFTTETKENDLNNNSNSYSAVEEKNLNIIINNSDYIENRDIITVYTKGEDYKGKEWDKGEDMYIHDIRSIYPGENISGLYIKYNVFYIYSKELDKEIKVELPELQDLDIEIDYLKETINVYNEVSIGKIK